MPSFGNPVQGYIRPPGSPLILGNMRVVCDFACHEARVPPTQGTDIGDGTCGKPVLAMTSGIISMVRLGKIGSTASIDASIVRIKRPDGYEVGVAHLAIKPGLAVGQAIVEGAPVGSVDKIGATACHVHVGCKDPSGVEVDVWPLLKQNQQGGTMPGYKIGTNIGSFKMTGAHALISPLDPKQRYLQPADAGPWDVAASLDLKDAAGKPIDIDGKQPPQNSRDQVFLVDAPGFGIAAWALRQDGVFTPKGGHSDAELIAAAKAARANGISDAAKAAGAVV